MSIQGNPSSKFAFRRAAFATVFMLVIASLACALPFAGNPTPVAPEVSSTPTTPPEPTATPNPLPPDLVESNPPISAEMPLNGPITLYFNQPMDHASVEAALTSQMKQELTFKWVDDTSVTVYLSKIALTRDCPGFQPGYQYPLPPGIIADPTDQPELPHGRLPAFGAIPA